MCKKKTEILFLYKKSGVSLPIVCSEINLLFRPETQRPTDIASIPDKRLAQNNFTYPEKITGGRLIINELVFFGLLFFRGGDVR